MISTENLTTKVKFGTKDKAAIAVGARHGLLTLQMLATDKKIGDKLQKTDAQELPKVEIEFFDTDSIDVVIKALETIKKNATPPLYGDQLALAC